MKQLTKHILIIIYFVSIFHTLSGQTLNIVLGRPTDKSITMNILFDAKVIFYVEYGTTSGNYSGKNQENRTDANVPFVETLTNLSAYTRYFYRISYRLTSEIKWKVSPEYSFQTWRPPGKSFSFTIEADPHPYDKKCYHPLWDIALQNQLNDNADFMIDMGDTFGDDHEPFTITNEEIRQLHLDDREYFGKICHSLPLFFCLGNHEGESGYYLLQAPPNNIATYGTLWRKYYYSTPFPDGFYSGNTQSEPNGIGLPENYYAWEWGDALIVVLDAYRYYTASAKPRGWDWTIGKSQYDWLKQILENSRAKFKFVFAHHVLGEARGGALIAKQYEWGGYDGKGSNWEFTKNRPGWEMPLHQLMVKNKVNIFFQGHDHLFAREELNGLIYQTIPMPSDSSYTLGMIANADAFEGVKLAGSGHLKVTVSDKQVQVDFVNAVLPKDETADLKNGDVSFSYTIQNSGEITTVKSLSDQVYQSRIKIYPNPFRDSVDIQFELQKEGNVNIFIYDFSGRQIDRIDAGFLLQGANSVKWDAEKRNGKPCKRGVYNCRIEMPDGIQTKKIIKIE